MHFVLYEDIRQKIYKDPGYIKMPDITRGTRLYSILVRLGSEHSNALSGWLNKINNQGITEINCRDWYYVREGYGRIPLAYLLEKSCLLRVMQVRHWVWTFI